MKKTRTFIRNLSVTIINICLFYLLCCTYGWTGFLVGIICLIIEIYIIFHFLFKLQDEKIKKIAVKEDGYTDNEINHFLDLYGIKGDIPSELREIIKTKSSSNLYNYIRIEMPDGEVIFESSKLQIQVYAGNKYYLISEYDGELYINDNPTDNAGYMFSLNPDIREFFDEIETSPETDEFNPWKVSNSLNDLIGFEVASHEKIMDCEDECNRQKS